jgi:cellulose synthase/poly-beta-1,6-N-acetylglucosamine synthase-like glycosyltransferase
MIEIIFWLLVFTIFYVYIGYPFLLMILIRLKPASPLEKADIIPPVTLIIAAYNEEKVIAKKIENCLALDYPKENIEIIVASDGSTDNTNEIVRAFNNQNIKLVTLSSNQGKSSVQNEAVSHANGEILFFSDATVLLRSDAVKKIVRNYVDKNVGCVVGKVTYINERDTTVAQGEGLYWRYELYLRAMESKLGILSMGSGPIMSVRRRLFNTIDPNAGEDFVLPIQSAINGYRVIYEPEAVSEEIMFQNTPARMFRSKVRIISKDLRGLFLCRVILNPFRYRLYSVGLFSHKVLRWLVFCFLITIFILNLLLLGTPFYNLTFTLQISFYIFSILGYLWQKKAKPLPIFGIPFSFCLVNAAALLGVARFIMGKKSGRWKPIRHG